MRTVVLWMAFALTVSPTAADAQQVGALTGIVTDAITPIALPGVKVTARRAGVAASAITDEAGRYVLDALPAGTYTVTAELAGFDTAVQDDVRVGAGTTTNTALALKPGCIDEVQLVDMGFARAFQDASLIAHITILDSDTVEPCLEGRVCVCTEHTVAVTRVLKGTTPDVRSTTIRLLEELAGRRRARPYMTGNRPYARGEEYIAFLVSDPSGSRFHRVNGPLFMFRVRAGRVEFARTDAPGLSNGMSLEEFSRALRALVTRAQ